MPLEMPGLPAGSGRRMEANGTRREVSAPRGTRCGESQVGSLHQGRTLGAGTCSGWFGVCSFMTGSGTPWRGRQEGEPGWLLVGHWVKAALWCDRD